MKNNYPTSMGKMRYVFCLTLLFSLTLLKAQKKVKTHKDVQVNSAAFVKGPKMNPFKKALNLSNSERGKINKGVAIDKAMIFDFDAKSTGEMMKRNPENLTLNLPFQNSQILELQLTKATIFAESFNVYRGNDRSNPIAVKKGHYYWGMVKGDPNSMVAISVFEDEITGAIRVNGKNLDLGKIKGNKNKRHILYENKDIKTSFDFSCDSLAPEQEGITPNSENPNFQVSEGAPLENCVQIYLEADYELFLQQGSVNAVVDHVTGSFNQVILLYANEQITMKVSELIVWDTPDPYTSTSTRGLLFDFRDALAGNYNGDLAHLITSSSVGGGIAYVDVLCNKTSGVGVSGIRSTYSDVPLYSWTVEVLAHEIGHNLGSPHTHSCSWNDDGTAIDDCGNVYYITNNVDDNGDGIIDNLADAQAFSPCFDNVDNVIPSNGGTIMSYCHLNAVGIDFTNGFGQQPGDLIRSNVNSATCLTGCGGTALEVSINESTDVSCGGADDGTATATASGGTGSYTYNWDNGSTEATISGLSEGSYTVTVSDGNATATATVSIANENITYYADADGDGFGDPSSTVVACAPPEGYVANDQDCDDANETVYIGAICDDGEACTIDDVISADCGCTGTLTEDSDGDGVCDAEDVCPEGDDTIDLNANGIPDACECDAATTNFAGDTLNHSGTGTSIKTVTLPSGSKNVSFTISGLNQVIDKKPANRFVDEVEVSYVDQDGSPQSFGTFSAANQSSVAIEILTEVKSITIGLRDGYDGDANRNLSVSTSAIAYCGAPINCIDSDGDGVCDADDICPNGDDTIDTDGDGIPDDCDSPDSACTNVVNSQFPSSTLNHSGSGSSISTLDFAGTTNDVAFTISGIDSRTNGNPSRRYSDRVAVSYIDDTNTQQTLGTFENQNSVDVTIAGGVQSVSIMLSNGLSGSSNSATLSVNISDVTSCNDSSASVSSLALKMNLPETPIFKIYPNPTSQELFAKVHASDKVTKIIILDAFGKQLDVQNFTGQSEFQIDTSRLSQAQLYFIALEREGEERLIQRLIFVE